MEMQTSEPFVLDTADNGCGLLMLTSYMRSNPKLTAGFTTRSGGVSKGDFDSLNCGLHVADVPEDVVENRRRLAEALAVPFEACTYAEQVHGKEIQIVTKQQRGVGNDSREKALQAKDGFITNVPGVFLHALFADCVPLYFYDPVHKAVGLAHAGWKGTALGIAKAVPEAMSAAYGTKSRELKAAVGPSIGMCCYEVDDTVIARMDRVIAELAPIPGDEHEGEVPFYIKKANGKYNLNLQHINRQIMMKAGILPSNIEISGLCTSCRLDLFYSHRKEFGSTGRMAAWIGLRD